MPSYPSGNPAQFIQGAPVLHVQDVLAAAKYYRDILGFRADFGDENYAVVWRDNAAIHFAKSGKTRVVCICFSGSATSTLATKKCGSEGPRSPQNLEIDLTESGISAFVTQTESPSSSVKTSKPNKPLQRTRQKRRAADLIR